jgi:hypothetical protein
MKIYTLENETNNITLHASAQDAEAVANAERFRNEAGLAKLAADWPTSRLVEIWNSLPGETPVKKFKDRATAVARIWKALQILGQAAPDGEPATVPHSTTVANVPEVAPPADPIEAAAAQPQAVIPETAEPAVATTVAPQTPDVSPEAAPAKNKATRAKKTPVGATTKEPGMPREGSKTSQVIAMLKREGGVTLEEIMTVTGWQKHTTRAMLSAGGSLTKNHGLTVISEKIGEKRVYSLKA